MFMQQHPGPQIEVTGTLPGSGTNSLREVTASNVPQTFSLPFSGYFPAGLKLRFVIWASGSGVTIQTATVSGSTAPAARLTYSNIVATRLT